MNEVKEKIIVRSKEMFYDVYHIIGKRKKFWFELK
jgi:hypothetical protein